MALRLWGTFLLYSSFLASCVPLADAVRVCVMLVVRRRRGILQLVVYCWRHKQSNGYEELHGCGREEEEKLVSDRIENPEAYPKGNLSNFATFQKRQEARNNYMKTGKEKLTKRTRIQESSHAYE